MANDPQPRFQGHDILQCHISRKWYRNSCIIYSTFNISETIQDRVTVTTKSQQEHVCDLWSGAISNDLDLTTNLDFKVIIFFNI